MKKARPVAVAKATTPESPVKEAHRDIDSKVRLQLFVVAGGRCEFVGCNKYLMEHHLTLTPGNFAQAAHVVAFKDNGPRGNDPDRPENINDISNLMLLCPGCHKLIDDDPADHPRSKLEAYKEEHEKRIKLVTSLGPEMKTSIIVFKTPIRGQDVAIAKEDISRAINPRYPASLPGTIIDTGTLAGAPEDGNFINIVQAKIGRDLQYLFQTGGEAVNVPHLSIFAIGPIALLIELGSKLSNKIPTDFYQRHRDTEDWVWKTDGAPAEYEIISHQKKKNPDAPVALILSLSGAVKKETLPREFLETGSIYEITLKGQTPSTGFLRQRSDLEAFGGIYREMLAMITREHGPVEKIALFSAIPAPVAVMCGRERLPKVHPALSVYDYDRATGGFNFQLEVS
ncbi:MAG: SAVED domain-containing protein [Alphaproteobacteria bacterium]